MENWSGIDSEMDNVSSTASETGDMYEFPKTGKALAIRDLGSKQVPWVGDEWPPMDQMITVTLSRVQWQFVLGELCDSIPIYEDIDDLESAGMTREEVALIEHALESPADATPGRRAPGTATRAGTRHVAETHGHQVYLTPFNAVPVWKDSWAGDQVLGVSDGPSVILLTGASWADVEVTIRALPGPPAPLTESLAGWELGEEETVEITEPLHGMDPIGEWYAEDAFVPARPGLYRVRVLVRGRVPFVEAEDGSYDKAAGMNEHYDVSIWPVEDREPRARAGTDSLSNARDS